MPTIKLIATHTRGEPKGTVDDLVIEAQFNPPANGVPRRGGPQRNFEQILYDVASGLREFNPRKEPIIVRLEGDFPPHYISDIWTKFNAYAIQEGVSVDYKRR